MFAVRKDYFDGSIAENYDDDESPMFDPAFVARTVDFLTDLAGDGAALELGIGTGRIALPLAARGVPVHGIDLSPGHGGPAAGEARCRRRRGDHR